MAREIWDWCLTRNIWLTVSHIPGAHNVIADKASRVFDDSKEWKVDVEIFCKVIKHLGTPEIDMFASRLNYQIVPYVSWHPDPQAWAIDAFTLDWSNLFFYAFPPFSVIPQVLQKLESAQAQAVLIVPNWQTQPWYPTLIRLLIYQPLLLPTCQSNVHLPFNQKQQHPLEKKLIDGLSHIRQSLTSKGISSQAQATILLSWRSGTQKQYKVFLDKWQLYANQWDVDPLHPTLNQVLNFLQELYQQGLSYSSINTARSALSSFITLEGNMTVGMHPLVQRYVKGVFQSRPALPRYTSTWDTSVVLSYLKKLHPADKLTLQQLTHKLVMLCALVTGQRCQSLHFMNLQTMHLDNNSSYVFYISQLVKQSAPARDQPVLVIPRFPPDDCLCVASVLDEYLKRTAPIRKNESQLFLSVIQPHHKVSKESISRWIKIVMQAAGIDTAIFKPHSTRSASTSKAKSCNAPMASILQAASWRKDCVFHRFYNKHIDSQQHTKFGYAILSAAKVHDS